MGTYESGKAVHCRPLKTRLKKLYTVKIKEKVFLLCLHLVLTSVFSLNGHLTSSVFNL